MLAQALDALDSPQPPPPDDVIDLIAPDLVASSAGPLIRRKRLWRLREPSTKRIPSCWRSRWPRRSSSGYMTLFWIQAGPVVHHTRTTRYGLGMNRLSPGTARAMQFPSPAWAS